MHGSAGPVVLIVLALTALWYAAALGANWRGVTDAAARAGEAPSTAAIAAATMAQERPLLPAPHQIAAELSRTVLDAPVTSRRSLVHHAGVTLSATLLGFLIGVCLGVVLAIAIVHVRTLERSLMPWIIASQTVPILAVAPIVIVALGSVGVTGVLPKAVISAYLSFFPVAIGMVKGLTSPEPAARDLLRTYSAGGAQRLFKLRLPASLPFLFASLKIAVAISLVGAIVGELPSGAQAGLGARMLSGSYYGQSIQIWAALFAAGALASLLVMTVSACERILLRRMGARE